MAVVAVLALLMAACSSGGQAANHATSAQDAAKAKAAAAAADGCVNLSPADAQRCYNLAVPGDPITITGSTKAGKWDDGWTEWFLPWQKFVEGSALHEAVKAGPDGSSFVNPSVLPASSGSSPLRAPPANNWVSS